ncbi:hypothetical protein B0H66DRAFT_538009 [Apodospora peruviana]|uniref:Uncharacterized protein n=1 Tax=Apodospora peruviana TaxID=516989 RepID=A0AAE0HVW9_9PEZI|nr:hypothetical protein B0H66DRAFT_538009 [Apodospora peruviana]
MSVNTSKPDNKATCKALEKPDKMATFQDPEEGWHPITLDEYRAEGQASAVELAGLFQDLEPLIIPQGAVIKRAEEQMEQIRASSSTSRSRQGRFKNNIDFSSTKPQTHGALLSRLADQIMMLLAKYVVKEAAHTSISEIRKPAAELMARLTDIVNVMDAAMAVENVTSRMLMELVNMRRRIKDTNVMIDEVVRLHRLHEGTRSSHSVGDCRP